MSEGKAPRIDPRFDPRFQRGYVPDAAAGAAETPGAPSAPTTGHDAAAPMRPPATSEVPPIPGDAPVGGAAGRSVGPPAHPAVVGERPPGGAASAGTDARSAIPEDEPVLTDIFGPSSVEESRSIAPWFIAGWGVAVVATVVGVALWWTSIANQNYYSGPVDESDRWLQAFGWMVAPSLIEAGLLAIVAMLVWTGVRHARRHENPS
ncbi:hypothetical protein [Agromyces sp. H66]|uniref:hypothetical protein n=1 Tax=Agromyces sp. H66 TaxID=2529859 RepID=UPI0010AA690B|nr:hypothetical protein [Agromyces sp. H66]